MSFSNYLDEKVIEEAVSSFKYTVKTRNIKDLFNHIKNWNNKDYVPEMEHTKAMNVYDGADKLLGTIKDKGKSFIMDNGLSKDKTFKTYIEEGVQGHDLNPKLLREGKYTDLAIVFYLAKKFITPFKKWKAFWVPRSENTIADELANSALDKRKTERK